MIFDHGFYHADPHPGNILVMDDNVIGLLDFGMVGRIDERLHEDIGEMLLAVGNLDAEHLTSLIIRVGKAPADLDRACAEPRRGRLPRPLRQPIARQVRP